MECVQWDNYNFIIEINAFDFEMRRSLTQQTFPINHKNGTWSIDLPIERNTCLHPRT